MMQRRGGGTFAGTLQQLLEKMANMPRQKAARLAGFLKQMLRDQQRQAPHLRHPVLVSRVESLEALMSVFLDEEEQFHGDEQEWCMQTWQSMLPFLEGETGERDEGPEADKEKPGPSSGQADAIEVVDSQEPTVEDGSNKKGVREPDGTQRNLTEEEETIIAENELMEEYAADMLREEDEKMLDNFTSTDLREWETWAARAGRSGPGVNRARVQVLVQGEGGRIIKKENWLVGLKDGESLSYSVSVNQAESEDEEPNPTAASSSDVAGGDIGPRPSGEPAVGGCDGPDPDGLLAVTGL